MVRKKEYFIGENDIDYGTPVGTVMSSIKHTYPQERDWTCSIACLRTLLSASNVQKSEDDFIEQYKLKPGPYNSEDIKSWHLVDEDKAVYGCMNGLSDKLARELSVLLTDFNVMVECMVNYAHWVVILGYVNLGSVEEDVIIYYDPYYNRVNQIIADEFFAMWYDVGEKPIHRDFVAFLKE